MSKKKKNKRFRKSKAERRRWWHSLTSEQQDSYIKSILERKAKKRLEKSKKYMKKHNLKFDCSLCIHGITGSCKSQRENGCEYFYNAKTGEHGPKIN